MVTITFSPTGAGTRTGTLTIFSNDPVYPEAGISLVGVGDTVYATPAIISLGSPTAQINNVAITLEVTGANFYPASVIDVNGIPQSTTYNSGEQLQATLSAAVTSAIGEVAVTVVNPSPGGGTSVPVTLTLYEAINVNAAFLTTVPGSPLIYASVPSSSATGPNTVISINPATGALGTPIPVGDNPGLLAASSDGSYLFVVSNQDQTVQRINLSTDTVDQTFPFPPNSTNCCGALAGADLKGVPASPQEVVLALEIPLYGFAEMALYNGTGLVNYVPTTYVGALYFSSFAYAGSSPTIYALPFNSAQTSFFNVITISAQGLQFTPPQYGLSTINDTTGAEVVSDGTLLYTSAGEIWNPATQTQVGSFPVTTYNDTSYPNLYNLVLNTSSGEIFVLGDQPYGGDSSSLVLSAYGQSSLSLTGSLAFPQVSDPAPNNLVLWGSNGFAFLAQSPAGNSEAVYLTTSSLATAVTSNPVPQLSALIPSSVPQGSSGVQLTVNGQGFVESSLVMWNGLALPTTYVANSVLTALVPTTDLASSGSASITVNNPAPGGGTSSAFVFTIAPLAPLVSFSSSAVNFSNQQTGTSSSAQSLAVENPGTATLNIASISLTGAGAASFQQSNTCGAMLAAGANCAVSLVFTPAAAGLQNASLSFADNASGSPQTVSISGTAFGLGLGAASGGSTSATVTAGGSATYSLVIGGAGVTGTATIACTGAPEGANCSVPASVSLSATATSPLTVTVTTTSRTTAAARPIRAPWFWAFSIFGLLAVPSVRSKQHVPRWLRVLPFSLLILLGSCGGGSPSTQTGTQSNPNGTPAGTYTLNIKASAGSASQSLSLSLTVQ